MPRRVCSCWSLRQINLVAVHGSHGQVLGSRSKPERAALPPATRRSARCEPCLIDDDRPLPSNPPAAGLKLARSRMAWLPRANGSFSGMGITGPVKRERQLATRFRAVCAGDPERRLSPIQRSSGRPHRGASSRPTADIRNRYRRTKREETCAPQSIFRPSRQAMTSSSPRTASSIGITGLAWNSKAGSMEQNLCTVTGSSQSASM